MSIVNRLHALLHRPERGWDPISEAYARQYAAQEIGKVKQDLLDELDTWANGLRGKRVVDLGGGPGHYSVALAARGAIVTWHDVSARYRAIAQDLARRAGVNVSFCLGYMDEADKYHPGGFDLVFNRICWNYGISDRSFSRVVFSLIRPGGAGYIDTNISRPNPGDGPIDSARKWLNDKFWIKIGHPFPPRGRLAALFGSLPIREMQVDYSSPNNDRIWLKV